MSDVRLVYVTVRDTQEAERIANAVVTEHLAACANILGAIQSIYYWQGQLERNPEVAMLLKTTQSLVPAVVSRVKSLHSYDCPAVLVLPVVDGNHAFLQWIRSETQPGTGDA